MACNPPQGEYNRQPKPTFIHSKKNIGYAVELDTWDFRLEGDCLIFKSSRIMWYFTQFEQVAALSTPERKEIIDVIKSFNLMKNSIEIAKMDGSMKAGALHLAISVCQFSTLDLVSANLRQAGIKLFSVVQREIEHTEFLNPMVEATIHNEASNFGFVAFKEFMEKGGTG